MARIHPKTRAHGVLPLDELPKDRQDWIAYAVAQPEPPDRWLHLIGGMIESRAWYEWHWARGRKWRNEDGTYGRPTLPKRTRAAVIERDGLVCGLCGGSVEANDVHIDHIHPYSLGGSDDLENLQVAHSICNIKKGARA